MMYSETMRNDEKVRYLIKTLSRTKRKNYENYVVNAIWNRISKKYVPYHNNMFLIHMTSVDATLLTYISL